jgi:hypothetical protein
MTLERKKERTGPREADDMKRALILMLLMTGCSSVAPFRKDTSFAQSKTTICLGWKGDVEKGTSGQRSALETAIVQTCIPGAGPVANGPRTKEKDVHGHDLLCVPIRCQNTLLTGQTLPAAE